MNRQTYDLTLFVLNRNNSCLYRK